MKLQILKDDTFKITTIDFCGRQEELELKAHEIVENAIERGGFLLEDYLNDENLKVYTQEELEEKAIYGAFANGWDDVTILKAKPIFL